MSAVAQFENRCFQLVDFPLMETNAVQVPCEGCGEPLFDAIQASPGHWVKDREQKQLILYSEDGARYYLCPHCKGKNHIVFSRNDDILQLEISHFTPGAS